MTDKIVKGSSTVMACEMKKICNNPFLSDVSFEVGTERKIFYGHKSILAARCEIFKSMFTDQQNNKNGLTAPVILQEMRPEIFKQLLEFIYSNQVKIDKTSLDDIIELLSISMEFGLDDFRKNLQSYLIYNLNKENVCKILQNSHNLGLEQLKENCLKFVFKNIKTISDLNDLSVELMEELVSSDELEIDELSLVSQVRNWAYNLSSRTEVGIEKIGRPVCRHLRLGLLRPEEIARLEDEDKDGIIPAETFALAWKTHALGPSGPGAQIVPKERSCVRKTAMSNISRKSSHTVYD